MHLPFTLYIKLGDVVLQSLCRMHPKMCLAVCLCASFLSLQAAVCLLHHLFCSAPFTALDNEHHVNMHASPFSR